MLNLLRMTDGHNSLVVEMVAMFAEEVISVVSSIVVRRVKDAEEKKPLRQQRA